MGLAWVGYLGLLWTSGEKGVVEGSSTEEARQMLWVVDVYICISGNQTHIVQKTGTTETPCFNAFFSGITKLHALPSYPVGHVAPVSFLGSFRESVSLYTLRLSTNGRRHDDPTPASSTSHPDYLSLSIDCHLRSPPVSTESIGW
jgi:hypothetical protein